MAGDVQDDIKALVAPGLGEGEAVVVVVPPTGSTGLFTGAGSQVAVVATNRRVIFVERVMTGSLRQLRDVPIGDVRVGRSVVGRMAFVLLAQLRLVLPDGTVTIGNMRHRREVRALRSLVASTNA